MSHEVVLTTSSGTRRFIIDESFCTSRVDGNDDNKETVLLFIATWLSLLSDSPLNPDDKPLRLYQQFLNRIRSEGVKALSIGYTDLAHKLVSNHTLMGTGSSIGPWIDDFRLTPIFYEYCRYYHTGDPTILSFIYTFLCFGKKLEYVDPTFDETAFRGWLDVEKRLEGRLLRDDDVLSLRTILHELLPRLEIDDLRPKFGPGSIAEKGIRLRNDKLRCLSYDRSIDLLFFEANQGIDKLLGDYGLTPSKVIPDLDRWSPDRGSTRKVSRLLFRPKNMKVARSVCMEPNTIMYFQQGVLREVLRCIDHSPLRRFIRINDQSRNRALALSGSQSGEIDTIDLSAASDSVGADLVKAIMPSSWVVFLMGTRTSLVDTPHGLFRVRKFAPMGSALCFPTQSIIFASVCIYAACVRSFETESVDCSFSDWLTPSRIRKVLRTIRNTPSSYERSMLQPLAIYGDDICLDRRLTDIVTSILTRLGFEVNLSKSFTGSQSFRESCGGYYLNGHDITPLYFRIVARSRFLSGKELMSVVHMLNCCWTKRYKTAYRFLHSYIKRRDLPKWLRKPSGMHSIPYVLPDSTSFGIFASKTDNTHLERRYNPDYQRDELEAWTISHEFIVRQKDKTLVDHYEYLQWWNRAALDTSGDSKPVMRHDAGGAGIRRRWIPSY
jgi:hypothetical protein